MQLVELLVKQGDSVVRTLPFKPGLNLILDKPTPASTQSGNSVGKTTVLRLIDFCLGSDGDDIWQDPEFKSINQDVFDFLHGTVTDETLVPLRYRTVAARLDGALWERLIEFVSEEFKRLLVASIQEAVPNNEAIKNAVQNQIAIPGAEVYRGDHLRVA